MYGLSETYGPRPVLVLEVVYINELLMDQTGGRGEALCMFI